MTRKSGKYPCRIPIPRPGHAHQDESKYARHKEEKAFRFVCCICGKPIEFAADRACETCQDECEKHNHHSKKNIVNYMFGCYCDRCGKSYSDI